MEEKDREAVFELRRMWEIFRSRGADSPEAAKTRARYWLKYLKGRGIDPNVVHAATEPRVVSDVIALLEALCLDVRLEAIASRVALLEDRNDAFEKASREVAAKIDRDTADRYVPEAASEHEYPGAPVVTLRRFLYAPWGTFGSLTLPDDRRYWTVEREWRGNERRASCIPEGRYPVYLSRFNKGGYKALELYGVPGRSEILFHGANWPEDVEGCIGPGTAMQSGTSPRSRFPWGLMVTSSRHSLGELYAWAQEQESGHSISTGGRRHVVRFVLHVTHTEEMEGALSYPFEGGSNPLEKPQTA